MVEKAKDIVERLRMEANGVTVNLNPWPTMREATAYDILRRQRLSWQVWSAVKLIPNALLEE